MLALIRQSGDKSPLGKEEKAKLVAVKMACRVSGAEMSACPINAVYCNQIIKACIQSNVVLFVLFTVALPCNIKSMQLPHQVRRQHSVS